MHIYIIKIIYIIWNSLQRLTTVCKGSILTQFSKLIIIWKPEVNVRVLPQSECTNLARLTGQKALDSSMSTSPVLSLQVGAPMVPSIYTAPRD